MALSFPHVLCYESPKDVKETSAATTHIVIPEETHLIHMNAGSLRAKICVDNTSKGLLLAERQVRELLCVITVELSF